MTFARTAAAGENLNQASAQTIASLFSISFRDVLASSTWGRSGTLNSVEFRPMVPFKVWEQQNLMRVTVPFRTTGGALSGLGNVRVFDLVTFAPSWGIWGVGPVVNLGQYQGPASDTIQGGPALGVVIVHHDWSYGLLNQNVFGGQISATTVQPILAYQFDDVWTAGLGELPFVYDWRGGRFVFVPVGFQVGALARVGEQPIRFAVNPQFNTQEIRGAPRWTITSSVVFLIKQ